MQTGGGPFHAGPYALAFAMRFMKACRAACLAALLCAAPVLSHASSPESSARCVAGSETDSDCEEIVMKARPASRPPGVVIGRQDLLEVKVFQLDKFDQTQRVGEDGSITLPLLGRVEVAGLTREQVEQRIAQLLAARYINDPQVSVFVREYESRKVSVTGAVQKPGSFEMLGEKTLLEMIAEAGGLTRDVAKEVIVIRRASKDLPAPEADGAADGAANGDGLDTRRITIGLDDLIRAQPAANILLHPGDIVYVPVEEIVRVYVNGAVAKPGALEVKRSEPITVLQAVTAAGGMTERASERRVQIIRRREDGTKEILPVDLRKVRRGRADDILLLKDDVVFVPEALL